MRRPWPPLGRSCNEEKILWFIIYTNRKLKKKKNGLQPSSYLSFCNITFKDSFLFLDDLLSLRVRVIASIYTSHLKISLVIYLVIAGFRNIKFKASGCR
jgi:hypothetical protein